MNKKLLASSAAALFLFSGAAFAQTAVTATADLNIRSGPGPQHPVVGVIRANEQAELTGCVEGSNWCTVVYQGMEGWAFSDYLVAEHAGSQVIVTERPAEVVVPVVTPDRTTEAGGAAGIVTGAIAGAIIGGPVGAAIGGVVGGAAGGATGAVISAPDPQVRTYVEANPVEPVYLDGEVVVGAGLPDTVEIYEIPDYEYRYAYVNGQPVLVEVETRRIVHIVR